MEKEKEAVAGDASGGGTQTEPIVVEKKEAVAVEADESRVRKTKKKKKKKTQTKDARKAGTEKKKKKKASKKPKVEVNKMGEEDEATVVTGEGGEKRYRIQVSNTKKPRFFYLNLAKRYIKQNNCVELSALGMAISTVVTISEILKKAGCATQKDITTSTVTLKDEAKGRVIMKAKIEILLERPANADMKVGETKEPYEDNGISTEKLSDLDMKVAEKEPSGNKEKLLKEGEAPDNI